MYEFTCVNCGKVHVTRSASTAPKKFCNRECWRQHNEKKRAAKHQMNHITLSEPLVPASLCQKCRFGTSIGGVWGCSYFEDCGHTRTSMHPEGLTAECKEYEPRTKSRHVAPKAKKGK